MTIWKNSRMEVFYYDGSQKKFVKEELGCIVSIDNEKIVLSYDDDEGNCLWEGKNTNDGHFKMVMKNDNNNLGSLHRFLPDEIFLFESIFLEGSWKEDGRSGMWKITLG